MVFAFGVCYETFIFIERRPRFTVDISSILTVVLADSVVIAIESVANCARYRRLGDQPEGLIFIAK